MFVKKLILVAALAMSTFVIGGCRSAAVYNVQDAPIASAEEATMQDVKAAIVRAGASLGWQMRPVDDGRIVGTLNLRQHMAEIDITYDLDSYDIMYRDSKNLEYNNGQIHSNYNGWIQNLDNAIQSQLSTLHI